MSRRLLSVALALVAALGLLGTPVATREVSAATPDLTIVADARYDVQPAQRRVRVTLTLTLANHLTDTKTTRYYFDKAFLAVLPGTKAFSMSWDGSGTPSVAVSKTTKDYTLLRLGLAQRLYSGKTATYRLRFDLPDPGGSATRDLRIGNSLASFPVWGFGSDSTPGGSVTVVFPKGFTVAVQAGSIPKPATDASGRVIFRSGRLSNPLSFFAYLVADRPGAYKTTSRKVTVEGDPVALTVQSWPDDKAWSKRVGDLMAKALPVLGDQIGLAWPQAPTLTVREAVSHSTGGYAGLFDPAKGLVEVAYYADSFVVLHESAHGWFNGALLADRWANEGFASYYALQAAAALKVKATGDVLTTKLKAARIPLNAWGPIGRDTGATEDYAYAASLALARAIGERATPDVLQAVWADAAGQVGAYQPPSGGTPETVEGAPDWRGFLDLLETESGNGFDDLWRTWVARDEDLPLLDARTAARQRYDEVVGDAGDWSLPRPIRDAMRAWRFDDATRMLDEASTIARPAGDDRGERRGGGPRPRHRRWSRRSRATTGSTTPSPRPMPRTSRSPRTGTPSPPDRPAATRSRPSGCGASTPRSTSRPPARRSRPGTSWRRRAPPTRPRPPGPARPRSARVGRSASRCSSPPSCWPSSSPSPGSGAGTGAVAARGCRRTGSSRDRAAARSGGCGGPGPVRYTRRHLRTGAAGRRGRVARGRKHAGLMGLQRVRPSHEILSGDSADVYFSRAELILAREGLDPLVTMEVFARQDAVLCGIDEAKNLLGHVLAQADPSETQLEALDDGDRIGPKEIVLRIRARYRRFGLYETAFLGMLAQSTGWATAARECVDAAAPEPVISFGARHIHPDITDVLDYAAIVGGCVGASTPAGARLAGLAPTGTMPHSLVLIFGDTVEASLAFDRHVGPEVPRIVLVDTFKDEAEEALRVAHALGDRLYGVRLDTPSERGRVTVGPRPGGPGAARPGRLQPREDHGLGRAEPGPHRLLQGGRRAGRLVRGRVLHQRARRRSTSRATSRRSTAIRSPSAAGSRA